MKYELVEWFSIGMVVGSNLGEPKLSFPFR